MTDQPEALRLADMLEKMPLGECDNQAAAELRRLHQHEFVNEVWQVKTQWVQDTAKPEELGMHRADVMRQRLEQAKAQRDALLEALKALLSDYDSAIDPGESKLIDKARAAIKAVEESQ